MLDLKTILCQIDLLLKESEILKKSAKHKDCTDLRVDVVGPLTLELQH
jgi:hypothetical protein